jgi:hypothetical protein
LSAKPSSRIVRRAVCGVVTGVAVPTVGVGTVAVGTGELDATVFRPEATATLVADAVTGVDRLRGISSPEVLAGGASAASEC